MERSDGRHRTRNTKRLAAALQHCIDEAVERGVERVKAELKANISNWNDTLHMIWTQSSGMAVQRLLIDSEASLRSNPA